MLLDAARIACQELELDLGGRMEAPPWTDNLTKFHQFLAEALGALRDERGDYSVQSPPAVEGLLDVVQPRETLFDAESLHWPLYFVNWFRGLEKEPPLRFDDGLIRLRTLKVYSVLVDDLGRTELAKTARLVDLFGRYEASILTFYSELIELELSAFQKSGPHSEKSLQRLLPANVLFGVGLATAWSAFAGHFLDLGPIRSLWDAADKFALSAMGVWTTILAWIIFLTGLFSIIGWIVGRYQNLKQNHRLQRINRSLKLYLQEIGKSDPVGAAARPKLTKQSEESESELPHTELEPTVEEAAGNANSDLDEP